MRGKLSIIIPAALIVLLGVYLIFRGEGRLNYELPELPVVEQDQVDRILLTSAGSEVILNKTEGAWSLQPQNWPADSGGAEALLRQAAELQPVDLISEEATEALYGLDDQSVLRVRLEQEGVVLREFFLGRKFSTGNYSYIRVPGDERVYSARGDVRRSLEKSAAELRSTRVMEFNPADIRKISYTDNGGESVIWTKTSGEQPQWIEEATGEVLEEEPISSLINRLSAFNARRFEDIPEESAYTGRLDLLGNRGYWIEIHQELDDGYLARSSMSDYDFVISSFHGESVFEAFAQRNSAEGPAD